MTWPTVDTQAPCPTANISRDEMTRARESWGSDVNEWGLLSSFEKSVALRDFSNGRVREHAPFYVYEIFRIGLEDRRNGS
jgi:hypothetical protein